MRKKRGRSALRLSCRFSFIGSATAHPLPQGLSGTKAIVYLVVMARGIVRIRHCSGILSAIRRRFWSMGKAARLGDAAQPHNTPGEDGCNLAAALGR